MRQRYQIGSAITAVWFLSVLLFLEGCASTASRSGVHFPITSGSHTRLPSERHHILIWGDPLLARMAVEWLRSHRYSNILIPPQGSPGSPDRNTAFLVAAEASADFVLMLEREELKEEALIQANCGARFNITVDVRGFSVEQREAVLRGSAHYPHCVERNDQTVLNLTCQALATAWGFRPSGQLAIPSHLACTAGQSTSSPNR